MNGKTMVICDVCEGEFPEEECLNAFYRTKPEIIFAVCKGCWEEHPDAVLSTAEMN